MPERQPRGLPQRQGGRAFSASLDSLTDTAMRPVHSASDTSGNSSTSGTSGFPDTSITSKAPSTPEAANVTPPQAKVARQHVKLRGDLADALRDAVWFLSEHGRPRVQLGEVLDEAVGEWLHRATAEHNGGKPFPHKGRLR